jgi:arylsulfatase A-like enzyme
MAVIRWFLLFSAIATSAQTATPDAVPRGAALPSSKSPNIILITLDTTRADRMDFLGSKRGLTPNLDLLANDSAVFTRAYAQAPLTPTSHATILTGTYPQFHQVVPSPDPLSKDLPYLPDILKARGYATAAFIGSLALNLTLTPGFDRGFDIYDADYSWKGYTPATRYQTIERRGGEVVERALAWLNKQQSSKQQHAPFFIWIHLFDPHDPYDPPEPYKTRYAKEPYDGEIAYVDSVMGNFFKQLKASGLYDGALIALTSDHGESLGAHGEDTHGIFLYDETIHVPLVIKLPSQRVRPRIESRVELADILPTVLENIGVDVPKQVQGLSLLKLMDPGPAGETAAEAWRDRGAYAQADYGRIAYGWSSLQSLRSGKYLYIQAPRRELYDDGLDPNAEHNLASASPAVADTLSTKLKTFQQETANPHPTTLAMLDDTRTKELASLGYMANLGSSPGTNPAIQRADPKDTIEFANVIYRANRLLEDLHCPEAVPKIQEMILTFPKIAPLHFFIGRCYFQEKNYEKAIPELRAAVQLDPSFVQDEMNLGIALMRVQNFDEAASAFEHVLKTDPSVTDAHVYLIGLYGKTNRTEEQIRECHTVLKLLPDNFGANLNLGQALLKTGDLKGAIAPLQEAIIGQPQRPAPHEVLAEVYDQLGRQADADRERTEAERLRAAMNGTTGTQQQ